jgi:hypothetical protein
MPTFVFSLIASVSWAGSMAGVYFGLRNRLTMTEQRMDRFRQDLDAGSSRFAKFEEKFSRIEETHRDHSGRLIRLETLLGAMDDKLDTIVAAVGR